MKNIGKYQHIGYRNRQIIGIGKYEKMHIGATLVYCVWCCVQMYHFVTAYFQQYMADFEPIIIFSLTDDLSVAIANTLKSTHNKHQSTVRVVCACSVYV